MKERQDSLAARIADTISGGVRRRQQEREPRAVLYDDSGEPRIVPAGSDAQADLVEAAERLVQAALDDAADPAEPGEDEGGSASGEGRPEPE